MCRGPEAGGRPVVGRLCLERRLRRRGGLGLGVPLKGFSWE